MNRESKSDTASTQTVQENQSEDASTPILSPKVPDEKELKRHVWMLYLGRKTFGMKLFGSVHQGVQKAANMKAYP